MNSIHGEEHAWVIADASRYHPNGCASSGKVKVPLHNKLTEISFGDSNRCLAVQ